MTTFDLIVSVTDRCGEGRLDRLEEMVGGPILYHAADGRGGMKLVLRPRIKPDKGRRRVILKEVRSLCLTARWAEIQGV